MVDCDIDVIDRGQLPGAPGARPGGMAAHDFFAAVRLLAADPRVRMIDFTEWDPPLDSTDLSALVAARAPVTRAMADLDALAATRVVVGGGVLPGDLAAIQAATSEAGAISQRHAELIDRLEARLASN